MENYTLIENEISILEDELEILLDKSEKILGYKSYNINEIINDLYHKKKDVAISLAVDILENRNELTSIYEKYSNDFEDDNPFNSLYDEDLDFN